VKNGFATITFFLGKELLTEVVQMYHTGQIIMYTFDVNIFSLSKLKRFGFSLFCS